MLVVVRFGVATVLLIRFRLGVLLYCLARVCLASYSL
jgi:hypothetical protein